MKNSSIIRNLLFITLLMGGFITKAQYYLKSAGLRFGPTSAITYKSFIEKDNAVEVMLSGRTNGIQLTGLYEQHSQANFEFKGNFFVYYGFGGHLGYQRYPYFNFSSDMGTFFSRRHTTYFAMGLDAIGGIEYRMLAVPITLNLDIKPYINFVGFRGIEGKFHDIAFSIKYTF